MKSRTNLFSIVLALLASFSVFPASGQGILSGAGISGNFQVDAQYYRTDSAIGAFPVPEKMLMNSRTSLSYSQGKISAGMRFESYLNPVNGYDPRYKGTGIPFWFATYSAGDLEVTAGHVYDQFGSGMVFRTYEEYTLGYDNSLYGIRVKAIPYKGIELKGVYGTQRYFWQQGPGIVRGVNTEFSINEMLKTLGSSKLRLRFGGSFVSKYEAGEQIFDASGAELILPLNVGASAARMNIDYSDFGFGAEYVQKINDPNAGNHFIYRRGEALLLTASYSRSGFGAFVQAKRLDNMSFSSKRTETGNVLNINYLPAISKQYAYSLASCYPYATQPAGEMGLNAQVNYKIKKNTAAGGRYGTDLAVSLAAVNSTTRTAIATTVPIGSAGTLGYESAFFKAGEQKYLRELSAEVTRRFSKGFKAIFTYLYQEYNIAVIQGHAGEPTVLAHTAVADLTWKLTPAKALRLESQALFTRQDDGNAVAAMLEYTIAPKWFFSVSDEWYYNETLAGSNIHYPMAAAAFNSGSGRIQLSYGKQREGVLCVGGICRNVPAMNGFTVSITSSF